MRPRDKNHPRRDKRERREGAVQSRANLRDRFLSWRRHHSLSATDSLYRVVSSWGSSLLTWLVIGIAMALPAALNLALQNALQIGARLDSPAQISVFMADRVPLATVTALARDFESRADVVATEVITRESALAEFRELSGFADIVADIDDNPLPHVILVRLSEVAEPSATRAELESHVEVDQASIDLEWLERLQGLLELSHRLVYTVAGVLTLGAILILGNTIRLTIESRREEIVIVKLMGGSNAFVRRPFLYTGLWYGVGGGLLSALLVAAALWYLSMPVEQLAALYESDFVLQGLGVMGALNLVLTGGILGLAGAWLAVSRHLGGIEPE